MLGHRQTHFSCWQIVSLHSVCKCAHHSQTAWMWFGTSVWSTLHLKTDRRETERVRNREGEGKSEGTPALLRKTPSVFPSLLSPPPQRRCCLRAEPKDGVRQMWGLWLCLGEMKRRKQDWVISDAWGAVILADNLWSWRLGLVITELPAV